MIPKLGLLNPLQSLWRKTPLPCCRRRSLSIETISASPGAESSPPPPSVPDLFRSYGCTDADVWKILQRQPSLGRARPTLLRSKLDVLRQLGLSGPDLVKIITCRPRFLSSPIAAGLDDRLLFLESLFGSRATMSRAILRNPSLLNYDVERRIKPCLALYERVGVPRHALAPLLVSRPTILTRSSLDEEKMEYIHLTGLPTASNMYKYVVSLVAVSRLDTIRRKVANLERFGFSLDDVMGLFARSPMLLTLSVDKVRRNMIYIIGTMKLPASVVLRSPYLLFSNLETVLKPRFLLLKKVQAMGLEPQTARPSSLSNVMRMKEPLFLRAFVTCHVGDVADDLMRFYNNAKNVKRLAQDWKLRSHRGFPF